MVNASFQIEWKHYDDVVLHSKVMRYSYYWTKRYLCCEQQNDHTEELVSPTGLIKVIEGVQHQILCAIML